MLDIAPQTLRSWEDRYGQIVPSRSAGGQRLYSREQVNQLRFVRELVESGLQAADAHRLLSERHTGTPDGPEPAHGTDDDRATDEGARTVILLAERDPYAAEYADYFLRTEGYAVQVVLDADTAQELIRRRQPQLVVIDLLISGGEGLNLCRAVRAEGVTPILAVSALDSGDSAVAAGADAFLQKPLDPLQFVSTVRDLLGTSAYLQRGNRP